MQNTQNLISEDEIDMRELFAILWAYKIFIACTCALGIVLGGSYALNLKKEFTSEAVFRLDQGETGGISLGGKLGALASFAGLGSDAGSSLPTDQIMGRIFIEKLDSQLHFATDPFFNKYNPNFVEPFWKLTLKRFIGWKKHSSDVEESIWQGIVSVFSRSVKLDETKAGVAKIIVTHTDATRAAEIANAVMNRIISNSRDAKNKEQDSLLGYMSSTLASALSDLEISQSKLKTFALENSALPLENFAAGSLQLDALREQLSRTSELHSSVAELAALLQSGATSQSDYLSLRRKFPIVDQVEFRRVLGQNEIITSWTWPSVTSVAAVFDTLSERKGRLRSEIDASQIDAERSGRALEAYAKLEREAKVAEATYTVLIEQVKAQSMVAGYRPDNSEVYEYAAPPVSASASRRSGIVTLGALLGLFSGCGLALLFGFIRGVHYSRKSLMDKSNAHFKASAKPLSRLRTSSLGEMVVALRQKPLSSVRNLAVEINKSGAAQVVITSSLTRLKANDVARALASYMQSETRKVAVIDLSHKVGHSRIDDESIYAGSFVQSEIEGNVSVLVPHSDIATLDLLAQHDLNENLNMLGQTFDLIFVCADNIAALTLLRAVEGQEFFHITLARTRHTKSDTLLQMRTLVPIQGLLYD